MTSGTNTYFANRHPRRRVLRFAAGLVAFFVGSVILRDIYGEINASIPLTPHHLPSRMPQGAWWPLKCRTLRYLHRKPLFNKVDQVECNPLLDSAFFDVEVHPPEPRNGWRCAEDSGTAACPIEWVTYSTHCTLGLNRLTISAHRAGIPFTVLGHGTGWVGWSHRLRLLHDYLINTPDDRIVVFTDADDVLLAPACTASDVITGFQDSNATVLFPAEVACWPKGELFTEYSTLPTWRDDGITPFHYLNAGVFIGRAGMLRAFIQKMYVHDCMDDQLLFTYAYLSQLSYYYDEQNRLKFSERRPLASFDPDVFPPAEDTPVPSSARPMIDLDMMSDLIIAMYDTFYESLAFPDEASHHPSSANSAKPGHGERSGYGTAKHIGTAVQTGTGGTPCIFHQQGNKKDNHVVELLARKWGMLHDANKLTRDELQWWGNR